MRNSTIIESNISTVCICIVQNIITDSGVTNIIQLIKNSIQTKETYELSLIYFTSIMFAENADDGQVQIH